ELSVTSFDTMSRGSRMKIPPMIRHPIKTDETVKGVELEEGVVLACDPLVGRVAYQIFLLLHFQSVWTHPQSLLKESLMQDHILAKMKRHLLPAHPRLVHRQAGWQIMPGRSLHTR